MATACNKSQDNVTPSNDQKALGMVLVQGSSNLILLEDGRAITPVSGFNPSSIAAGDRFVLSFETIESTGYRLSNVRVKKFTSAADSTFSLQSTPLDSAIVKTVLQGLITGTFTYNAGNFIAPSPCAIAFDNINYASTPSPTGYPAGGSGTFTLGMNGGLWVSFTNTHKFPAGTNQSLILNGIYHCAEFDKYIALWNFTSNTYSCYLMKK
jgi:hypothetical protein